MNLRYFILAATFVAITIVDKPIRAATKQPMPYASIWDTISTPQGPFPKAEDRVRCFIEDCEKYAQLNNIIPSKLPDVARVATFNVHYWDGPHKESNLNYDMIMQTIQKINADILILEEVCWTPDVADAFRAGDYHHQLFCQTTIANWVKGRFANTPFGNVMLSKFPLSNTERTLFTFSGPERRERRCYVKANIILPNNKKLTLYGAHLDIHTEASRLEEIQELTQSIAPSEENIIVTGDFNAVRKEDYQYNVNGKPVWELVEKDHAQRGIDPTPTVVLDHLKTQSFVDCFTVLGVNKPKFTVWSGTVVDFIFLKNWRLPLDGCYVYYDASSDHIPVIMDIKLEAAAAQPVDAATAAAQFKQPPMAPATVSEIPTQFRVKIYASHYEGCYALDRNGRYIYLQGEAFTDEDYVYYYLNPSVYTDLLKHSVDIEPLPPFFGPSQDLVAATAPTAVSEIPTRFRVKVYASHYEGCYALDRNGRYVYLPKGTSTDKDYVYYHSNPRGYTNLLIQGVDIEIYHEKEDQWKPL